ncbi:hypothetical protein SLEP1_g17548 [Rubroshorea leprosula]|uniref:Uncharacterized protein n=1 Tax=Rubroshorea leprosula TaxID=152421 RepID=A0AAV5J0I7_9ROSI|nr:hypothetical protein SLEP1_g17548 [Rubroshorea leprosula]
MQGLTYGFSILLISSPLQPPEREKKRNPAKPTAPLGKLVRKLDFSFFSCSRTQIESRNFPHPSAEFGSALLCPVAALASCGCKFLEFSPRELLLHLPPASPPAKLGFCSWKIMEVKPRTEKPREVTS